MFPYNVAKDLNSEYAMKTDSFQIPVLLRVRFTKDRDALTFSGIKEMN